MKDSGTGKQPQCDGTTKAVSSSMVGGTCGGRSTMSVRRQAGSTHGDRRSSRSTVSSDAHEFLRDAKTVDELILHTKPWNKILGCYVITFAQNKSS